MVSKKKHNLQINENKKLPNNRPNRLFKKNIINIFTLSGFTYIDSENHQFKLVLRNIEIDFIFLNENIILVCEETNTTNDIKRHIRNKQEAFEQIEKNKQDFINWLSSEFSNKDIRKYSENQYTIKYLYFSQNELNLSTEETELFPLITFIEPRYLEYFVKMAKSIQKSVKYEIFRFLCISKIGNKMESTESDTKCISETIISPKGPTGLEKNVRIVSFMISAETLIKYSYVLRKDNWEDSIILYQRLIQKEKIKGIRKFLANKRETFYNNIIVSLPNDTFFLDKKNNTIEIDNVGNYNVCKMYIPDRMNSICIIDGQHRVFAYYEGENNNDPEEKIISNLRNKLHLLVTGLVFTKEISDIEKSRIESEIFLDINTNSKPVPPDVLLHIKTLKEPLSDIGLARAVIERLNKKKLFLRKFELTSLELGKIKIASIIKFALRYLVTIEPKERKSFYSYWTGDKEALTHLDDTAYKEYLDFCTSKIEDYFSAIRDCFTDAWNDPNSKLLSVIAINGFIIAYNRFIDDHNVQGFNFFREKLKNLEVDFSKENFLYTSSQYKKFSSVILEALLK